MDVVNDFYTWLTHPSNRAAMWIVLGTIGILLLLSLLGVLLPRLSRLPYSRDFPTATREANLLALGLQQIASAGSLWNDPLAGALTATERRRLGEQWNLRSAGDVVETVQILVATRRRREPWQQWLALRGRSSEQDEGVRTSGRRWIAAICEAGGEGDALDFAKSVAYYERRLGRKGRILFPADEPVVTLDAYALGQAVAVAVWGVALGHLSHAESRQLIERINACARAEFRSWEAFGRSYTLGHAMHGSDGARSRLHVKRVSRSAYLMLKALDGRRNGPWGLLPWRV